MHRFEKNFDYIYDMSTNSLIVHICINLKGSKKDKIAKFKAG